MTKEDQILSLLENLDKKQDRQAEEIANVRVAQGKQEALFAEHMKQDDAMRSDLCAYNVNLQEYNGQLKIHIAGVQELKRANDIREQEQKKLMEEMENRLAKVEAPRKWAMTAFGYILDLSKLLVALAIIYYVLHTWPHVDVSHLLPY